MQRQKNIVFNAALFLNVLLFFLLLVENRISVPAWLQVFGRMHPMLVHFPIVMILIYFACVLLIPPRFRQELWYTNMVDWLLLASSILSALTALMGLFLSRETGYDADAILGHKWFGALTSITLFGLCIFRARIQRRPILQMISALGVSLLVVLAGHFGGNITHGNNYVLAPVTPEKKRILPAFEDAIVYTDMVEPILETKCMSCHNTRKAKGELVMETQELLLKGGKDGKLWDTTEANLGLMMERIHMPEEEKKHMPPTGKPQLTPEEILVLYTWIKSGARFDQRVAELLPTDTLYAMALKNFSQSSVEQYDFAAADEATIQKLSNNNRVITPLFLHSPALVVNFYNSQYYDGAQLGELKPLANQIVELNLDHMPVKDEDLKTISTFSNLRRINLNNTDITGTTLGELQNLQHLRAVSLSGTAVKTDQLSPLVSMPALRTVYLWDTGVDSTDIKNLAEKNKDIAYQFGFRGDTVVMKLTPPVIGNEERIITAAVPLQLKHYINGTIVRYTLDGTEPDSVHAAVYQGDVELQGDMTVKARAYKPGWISSDVVTQRFFKSTFRPDSVVMTTPADPQYKAEGERTLFDLRKSELEFRNGGWVGYRLNPMELMLFFNKPIDAHSITMSVMKDIDSYIFPPLRMEVWGGKDAHSLKLLGHVVPLQPQKESLGRDNLAITCHFQSSGIACIKLVARPVSSLPKWHRGKGEKGWIFVDEVFVN